MSGQKRPGPYPVEVRERAVRMVFEHQHKYPSQWKAIESISPILNINWETLVLEACRAETDAGKRPGVTTEERARIKELERENRELRRANDILKAASLNSRGQRNTMLESEEVANGEDGKTGDVRRGSGDVVEVVVGGVVVLGDLEGDRVSAGVDFHGGEAHRRLRARCSQAA
jgi:transposase